MSQLGKQTPQEGLGRADIKLQNVPQKGQAPPHRQVETELQGGAAGRFLGCTIPPRARRSHSPLTPASVPISQSLVQGGLPGSGVPSELPQLIPVFPGGTPLLPPVVGGSIPVSSPLPPASFGLVMDPSKKLAASVLDALDPPGPTLDPLDLLPYSETRLDALDSFGSARGSLDKPDSFMGEAWLGTSSPPPHHARKVLSCLVSGEQRGRSEERRCRERV